MLRNNLPVAEKGFAPLEWLKFSATVHDITKKKFSKLNIFYLVTSFKKDFSDGELTCFF